MFKIAISITLFLTSSFAYSQVTEAKIGAIPSKVEISGENGGRTDGKPWDSSMIRGKIYSFFYVDPDEKGTNDELEKALKKEKFDREKFGSIAVINLAATWKPDYIIGKILAGKQKEFPATVYVKDKKSLLVKKWGLADDAYNTLLFDKDGTMLFKKHGTLSKAEINELIQIIKSKISG